MRLHCEQIVNKAVYYIFLLGVLLKLVDVFHWQNQNYLFPICRVRYDIFIGTLLLIFHLTTESELMLTVLQINIFDFQQV